jgi:hypothetical protein
VIQKIYDDRHCLNLAPDSGFEASQSGYYQKAVGCCFALSFRQSLNPLQYSMNGGFGLRIRQ